MGEAIGAALGYAAGIALSPVPIAAVILMLFTERARVNSLLFTVGWILGIAAVTTALVLMPGLGGDGGAPSDAAGWIKLGLGVLLLTASVAQWRDRPRPDVEPEVPGWMERIDGLRPAPALGLGLLFSALNPKNLVLAAAGGATIGAIALSDRETVAAIVIFTAIAASTVILVVATYLIAGHRADVLLDRAKNWLIRNNKAIMAVLFVVFGIGLIGDGIEILSD